MAVFDVAKAIGEGDGVSVRETDVERVHVEGDGDLEGGREGVNRGRRMGGEVRDKEGMRERVGRIEEETAETDRQREREVRMGGPREGEIRNKKR